MDLKEEFNELTDKRLVTLIALVVIIGLLVLASAVVTAFGG